MELKSTIIGAVIATVCVLFVLGVIGVQQSFNLITIRMDALVKEANTKLTMMNKRIEDLEKVKPEAPKAVAK